MTKIRIAILGTRGIPNQYGGFEQFAEFLSCGLPTSEFEVYVYSPHYHPYKGSKWEQVHILHKHDPEKWAKTAGQFIYDFNCIIDSRKRDFDIILQLGYTSSSVWSFLFPRRSKIITNMDGLEWKRTKYSASVQRFLRFAEKLAVKKSDILVADSLGIKKYLAEKYGVSSVYIPYGATVFNEPDKAVVEYYQLSPFQYDMLIARLEPENSIETILDGHVKAGTGRPFLVIANHKTRYGDYLRSRYKNSTSIRFLGSVYDMRVVNNLRYYSNIYFHGHTVGGTNPSLLEAMASHALIAAHRNSFNEAILGDDAYYFTNVAEVTDLLARVEKQHKEREKINANLNKIAQYYTWPTIINDYAKLFRTMVRPE